MKLKTRTERPFMDVGYQKGRHISIGAYASDWVEMNLDGQDHLFFASFIGHAQAVQGILAACRKGAEISRMNHYTPMKAKAFTQKGEGGQGRSFTEKIEVSGLSYLHGIWIAPCDKMFLKNNGTYDSLRHRFNIPGLPQWAEAYEKELSERELIRETTSYGNTEMVYLEASEEDLDQIASDLVTEGHCQF
jgi:hypothetical protein